MKIFINELRHEMIFTENEARKFCMTFHDEYISLVENETAKEMVQVDIDLDENGVMKIGPELEKIFEMRGLLNRAIVCVGPYDIFGRKGFMIHIDGCKVKNPVLEAALLEKIDWDRNQKND